MEPYNIITATDAALYVVVTALKGRELDNKNILAAELAIAKAVDERVTGVETNANIEILDGRYIKLTVTDTANGAGLDPYEGEFEV